MAPLEAACWAVYLHAASGDRLSRAIGGVGYLAREIVAELPRTLRDVSS
jgi:NAD(P)H-hydrate repair Nnr-like enzyme with NAD(P)H-hydrate dehydratase domain